jgi:ketosteroid isomerase-like protein
VSADPTGGKADQAAATAIVRHYFDALVARDWIRLSTLLAADVVRNGPYGDDFEGRDEYVGFLRSTFATLRDYDLRIRSISGGATTAVAEITETVTMNGARLATDEAIVFEVGESAITRVGVYLQASYDPTES